MSKRRGLVLDANILLRAVFGNRVRGILERYENRASFYTPEVCFAEAERYIPTVAKRRGFDATLARTVLGGLKRIVQPIEEGLYERREELALQLIGKRDPRDWPVVAVALFLKIPVWTEDRDFFGSGLRVWTTDRVELYLHGRV